MQGNIDMPCRRDFILASLAFGMFLIDGKSLAGSFKHYKFKHEPYKGPLLEKLLRLAKRLDSGQLAPSQYALEVQKRLRETKGVAEFKPWFEEIMQKPALAKLYESSWDKRRPALNLFFIPKGLAHAPHAHHSLTSTQLILSGKIHLRQYDRIKRIDRKHLGIRLTSDRVLKPGEAFRMTDFENNIHWFGAESEHSLLLNCNLSLINGKSFDPRGSRKPARYYIDPTSKAREDSLIIAPQIWGDENREEFLEKFEKNPLSKFSV